MDIKDITVVVPTYNQLTHLRCLLKSLENQRPHPPEFKVIIVDDGSHDGTVEFLKAYNSVLDLECIFNGVNLGRGAARNRGAARVESRILLFLDGDMECSADLVAGHSMKHHNDDSVIIGRVIYDRNLGRRAWTRYLETRGCAKLRLGQPVPGRYFLSGHSSLSKRLFDAVGGFDEKLLFYGEDIDMGLRLAAAGAAITYAPELSIKHLHTRDLTSSLRLAYEYGSKTLPYLTAKHPQLLAELGPLKMSTAGIKGYIYKFLLNKYCYGCVKTTAKIFDNIWTPAVIYDYLLFRNYYSGFKSEEV